MFVQLLKEYFGHKPEAIIDVEEPVAKGLIASNIAKALETNPLDAVITKGVESMLTGINKGLESTIEKTLQQFAQAQTLSRKGQERRIFGGEHKDPTKTFGAYLMAVRHKNIKALEEMGSHYVEWENGHFPPNMSPEQKATLVGQQGTLGGFAIPTEHHDEIMTLAAENSIVRKRAFVLKQSGKVTEIPYLDHTTAPSSGNTAYTGGLVLQWSEEASSITEDNPTLKMAKVENYELTGYVPVGNTLNQDVPALESFLKKLFGTAVGWYEDYAFLRGTGAGQPLGAINWAGFLSLTRSAASAFALADYATVVSRWLGDWNPKHCCWVCFPTVFAKVLQMNASGTGSPLIYLDNVREKPGFVLGGLPLEISEKVPALNTAGDIALYDFSKYVIGDRSQIEIAFSEHYLFKSNQTAWRVVSRVGGMPWLRDKITLADASTTISPFVGLAAG